MKKSTLKTLFIDYIPMALVATLIVALAILEKQSFIKTLPTLITLVVQILLVRANRFAFLLGGLNSLLYGITFLSEGVYFSAISAFGLNVPIQLFAFFNWGKSNSKKSNAKFKTLSKKAALLTYGLLLVGFLIGYFAVIPFFKGSNYPIIDLICFVLAFATLILSTFKYIESQYISFISTLLTLFMWILICIQNPANANYIIINLYNLYRVGEAAVSWTIKYKQERANS